MVRLAFGWMFLDENKMRETMATTCHLYSLVRNVSPQC